jgi:hypothetical protein
MIALFEGIRGVSWTVTVMLVDYSDLVPPLRSPEHPTNIELRQNMFQTSGT